MECLKGLGNILWVMLITTLTVLRILYIITALTLHVVWNTIKDKVIKKGVQHDR